MLRKICSVFLVTMLLTSIALGYSGGSGIETDPYLIGSVLDLQSLGSTSADWSKYFKLTGNINLSGYPNIKIGTSSTTPFSGKFDGDGRTISNYTFTNAEDYGALFGYISSTAVIEDVKMTGVNISTGSGKYAAALVGNNYGKVEGCSSAGTVTGGNYCAGLVARNYGTITRSSSSAIVTSQSRGGCLTAYNGSGASISQSCAEGRVTAYDRVGGLVGENIGNVTNCYSSALANGTEKIGGLVGSTATGTITNSYSYGAVTGTLYKGAVIGDRVSGSASGCFFDNQASGLTSGVGRGATTGVTGKTTTDMKNSQTYSAASWDFNIWIIITGYDYPRFDGVGTPPPLLPNLAVSTSATTINLLGNGQVSVPVSITNSGNSAAGGFTTSMYMSNTNSVDWDTLGDSAVVGIPVVLPGLASGATYNSTITYSSTLAPGTYYFRVKTDKTSVVNELVESDNWSTVVTLIVAAAPDLTVTANQSTYSVSPGSPVNLTATVTNGGTAAISTTFVVSLYMSSTVVADWPAYISTHSPVSSSSNITSLAAGASTSVGIFTYAPYIPGQSYMCMKVDNANVITESNETNNYTPTLNLVVLSGRDLSVTSVPASLSPAKVGESITVPVTIKNTGTSSATNFTTAFYLSANGGTSWTLYGSFVTATLGANASATQNIQFTAPAAGSYKAKVVVDTANTVIEDNESNNTATIGGDLVITDTIDLSIASTGPSSITVSSNDSINVPVTITNSGSGGAGSFVSKIYISTDSGSWNGATSMGEFTTATVAAGDTATGQFSFYATMQPGTYYLRATADTGAQVAEINESNNNSAVITLVVGASVDLVVQTVPTTVEAYLGGPVDVSVTVRNVGSNNAAGATAFTTSLYLSQSKYVDWNTLSPVATFNLVSLAGSTSHTQVMTFDHELLVGSYYLRVKTDSNAVVIEGDENNNWSAAFDMNVSLAYSGGIGTASEPYIISNIADLMTLSGRAGDWDKYFVLTADLDMTGQSFAPIGNTSEYPFKGSFDGGNHIISNLVVNAPTYGGMFGQIDTGASVSGIGLENILVVSGDFTGALAGWSFGSVRECYATGTVAGNDNTAGLIGGIGAGASVSDCYAACDISGAANTAGLIGSAANATITNCYTSSWVNATVSGGGLVAAATNVTSTACFWDTETTSQLTSAVGTGKTTAEMGDDALYAGWDTTNIWLKLPGVYPIMQWQTYPYGGGSGTVEDPYQIYNGAQFKVIGSIASDWDKHFILMDNIDFAVWTMNNFMPIGDASTAFTGSFNGNKKKFTNMTASGITGDYAALFGNNAGTISELIIEGISLGSSAGSTGFVGLNSGTISKCYMTGSVTTSGGKVGAFAATNSGSIENSYSMVNITATSGSAYAGLLTGENIGGDITNCYGSAILTASSLTTGAITGYNDSASIITSCYWNRSLTSLVNAAGTGSAGTITASGVTDAQMKQQATFAGWNFATIWKLTENFDYPRLNGIGVQPVLVPDLIVSSATPVSISAYTSQSKSISVSVKNTNLGASAASVASLYLTNADSGWDALSDTAMAGSLNVGALAANATGSGTITFNAPAAPGVYYLKVKADKPNAIAEMSETNNWSSVITLTVAPDTDLTATYLGAAVHNYASHPVTASIRANNTGTYPAGGFTVALYRNTVDSGWDALGAGNIVGSFTVASLAGGANTTDSVTFNVPATPGAYYLRFKVDSGAAVTEKSETNNWSTTINLTVDSQADLWSDIVSTDKNAYTGASLDVDMAISNSGNGAASGSGDFTTSLYISSTNTDWDTLGSGAVVASFATTALASGATSNKTLSFNAPALAGIYYLRAKVDAADGVFEYNAESNNWSDVIMLTVKYGFSGGSGTELDPYLIYTTDDLVKVAGASMQRGDCYKLMNDLDMTGVVMGRIGTNWNETFSGTFDGACHIISNLTINAGSADYAGLFGAIDADGKVMNLGLVNVSISTTGNMAGAIAGWNNGTIQSCFTTGTVTGGENVGGISGGISMDGASLSQSYSGCSVSGSAKVGGLAGSVEQADAQVVTVSQSYTNGVVTSGSTAGGLIAAVTGAPTITGCFWDTQTTTQTASAAGTAMNTAGMINMATYTSAGWDFIADGLGNADLWYMAAGDYPQLAWAIFTGGNGTAGAPFVLETAQDVQTMADMPQFWAKYFALGRNINISALDVQIGSDVQPFTGVLNGHGFALTGYTATAPDSLINIALFGNLGTGGLIHNLKLENASVDASGVDINIAALVAVNNGTIANCFVDGAILSDGSTNNVGAIAGQNLGTISGCFSSAAIISSGDLDMVGLIAGYNSAAINNCYGDTAIQAVGSLCIAGTIAGINESTITNCYSTAIAANIGGDSVAGAVVGINFATGVISGCYYDSALGSVGVGAGSVAGVTGITSAAMKLQTSYVGWDFGTIWTIKGNSYPTFLWLGLSGDMDGDADVDGSDLILFASQWLSSGAAIKADINTDGVVNILDFASLAKQWLTGVDD